MVNHSADLSNDQGAWNAPVQSDEPNGMLPGKFNQVTVRNRLRALHERRQLSHAEVVGNEFKPNSRRGFECAKRLFRSGDISLQARDH
jgi:predicted nucleotidyltransferase